MATTGPRTTEAGRTADALAGALQELGEVSARGMFGGYGIFAGSKMFALVDREGTAYFRGGPDTVGRYEAAGSARHGKMPYWRIPDEVMDDEAVLREWAAGAIAEASAAKPSKPKKGRKAP